MGLATFCSPVAIRSWHAWCMSQIYTHRGFAAFFPLDVIGYINPAFCPLDVIGYINPAFCPLDVIGYIWDKMLG